MPDDSILMHVFDFTVEDLQANKTGRVSERQIAQIRRAHGRVRWVVLSVLGGIALLISVVTGLQTTPAVFLVVLLALSMVCVGALLFLRRGQQNEQRLLRERWVRSARGELQLHRRNSRSADHITIGKKHFTLTPKQHAQLTEYVTAHPERRYYLYYVPDVVRVFSIEPVSSP
jgi:heme/copper-type cytochrome/quinol oxidase subunit 4